MNIKGIEIKAFKDIEGHGDSRTFQANIYIDGKKSGTVMNNGWGGGHEYHFSTKEAEEEFFKRAECWVNEGENRFDADILIEDLIVDIENQKEKKRNMKDGYSVSLWCKKGKEVSGTFIWWRREWIVGLQNKNQMKNYIKKENVEWYKEIV